MYRIPYRRGLFLKKLLRIVLIAGLSLLVLSVLLLIYLEPYVTYDRNGAHLSLRGEQAQPTPSDEMVSRPQISDATILFEEKPQSDKTILEQGGYYITTAMLQEPQAVLEEVRQMNAPCAIMLEVKSIFGNFYYSTAITGAQTADVDVQAVDELIAYLRRNGFYMIAVVPAFRDYNFALENTACGLPLSGGALWMDSAGCYWLDPANTTVLSYAMQIARELSSLGFHEVAYSDFLFPDSSNISYTSELSHDALIEQAASQLTNFFTGSNLTVSFVTERMDFPAKACTGRLYITDADGSKVERYAQAYEAVDAAMQELVFLANSRDSRFNDYATLRPLVS